MGCDCTNNFQQVRLGEMLVFEWSGTTVVTDPLEDLANSIDVGGADKVAVTFTVCSVTLGTNVTGVRFDFETAPINNDQFFDNMGGSGTAVNETISAAGTQFKTAEGLSRFFHLVPNLVETGASGTTKLVVTIDVLVKG